MMSTGTTFKLDLNEKLLHLFRNQIYKNQKVILNHIKMINRLQVYKSLRTKCKLDKER